MSGAGRELPDVEREVLDRTAHLDLDQRAMAIVSNVFRASTAIRRHMEGRVLAESGLSWTAFVALWCLWIWGEMESRDLAAAVGITKPTATGVVSTLERRGLAARRRSPDDGRMVRVALTAVQPRGVGPGRRPVVRRTGGPGRRAPLPPPIVRVRLEAPPSG